MHRYLYTTILTSFFFSASALAGEPLKGRVEGNWRYGSERSILMNEFWVPLAQDEDGVFYGDYRMMGDDYDNYEFNLGVGYRQITLVPFLGQKGIVGVNGWLDRRMTAFGSTFHQVTVGAEWLGESIDLRMNGYLPLSDGREIEVPNAHPKGSALVGTGIVVNTNGRVLEEPLHGFDLELGWELGNKIDFVRDHTDSFRVYGGAYYFDGPHTEDVAGVRARFSTDVTENIQLGARFQRDDERGSQGFLEATFRFPFGYKKNYRHEGLRARLDESPERDIDIVTGKRVTETGDRVKVLNKVTGQVQEVLTVDNTAAGGGDGSAERPFNTLAAAEAAASAHTIIYVRRGDGTSTGQNQGITLNKDGQQLIGSGTNFVYESGTFTTANGKSPSSLLIAAASSAPIIGNIHALGDGVRITADNINLAGFTVDNGGTGRDGIVVEANGAAASAQNITIQNVTARNARMGIYLHGSNGGSVSAKVQNSVTTSNSQHGIAVYDDTNGTFDVDLGGGSLGSAGQNVLAGNTLEDLAVDYDGRTLAAMNNWWGQASGPDTDAPNVGIAPQIYYGAPINDGLVGHWTFDTEWTTNTTAYDRSSKRNNGTLQGGVSLADSVSGASKSALKFDGINDIVSIPDNSTLDLSSKMTILLFVNPAISKVGYAAHPLSKWGSTTDANFVFYYFGTTSGVVFDKGGFLANRGGVWGSLQQAYQPVPHNTWTQYAISYDASVKQEFFVNGSSLGSSTNLGNLATNNSNLLIGSLFPGSVDDTRIYNRALSAQEISELYRMNTSSIVNAGGYLTAAP